MKSLLTILALLFVFASVWISGCGRAPVRHAAKTTATAVEADVFRK
jgi:hypothetical protein